MLGRSLINVRFNYYASIEFDENIATFNWSEDIIIKISMAKEGTLKSHSLSEKSATDVGERTDKSSSKDEEIMEIWYSRFSKMIILTLIKMEVLKVPCLNSKKNTLELFGAPRECSFILATNLKDLTPLHVLYIHSFVLQYTF